MVIDMQHRAIRWIAPTAVIAASLIGFAMNAQFGWSLGSTTAEKTSMAVLGVSFDFIKLFALAAAMAAFSKKLYTKGVLMFVVWLLVLFYGLVSALGFVSQARTGVLAERQAEINEYRDNKKTMARLETKMAETKQAKLWKDTDMCFQPKGNVQNTFCRQYWLDYAAWDQANTMTKGFTEKEVDPQLAALQMLFGKVGNVRREGVSLGMSMFVAVMIELISSVGLYGFSKSRKPYEFRSKDEDDEDEDDEFNNYPPRAVIVDEENNIIRRPPGRPSKNPTIVVHKRSE